MPRYFFDIKDGHRLVDPSGSNFDNDTDAIDRAKVIAIGVSLDEPGIGIEAIGKLLAVGAQLSDLIPF